ncbi:MAG: hypothetical protein ACPIA7_03770 [Akkermansiaceae bacterium]
MPKEPAILSSGDAAQHHSSPNDSSIERHSDPAPFSSLTTSSNSRKNPLDSMPAFPSAMQNQEESGAKINTDGILESLASIPALPTTAPQTSRRLLDQDKQLVRTDVNALPLLPSESPAVRLSPSEENNHSWEPSLPNTASKENTPSTLETAKKPPLASPPIIDKAETGPLNKNASKEAKQTRAKSPLVRAELLEKIRNKRPHQETNKDESPFTSIASETSSQSKSSRSTLANPPTTPIINDANESTATPFAETELDETNNLQTKYTDKDLQDALRPLLSQSKDHIVNLPANTKSILEPMLRSTVRRAIAEQMAEASPFRDIPGWDKLAWKIRALMSSRTYDEILFSQTRRYQVEEVFLLRPQSRSLISYASNNPARHAKSSKVESTVKKIATKTATIANHEDSTLEWSNDRQLVIRSGKYSILAAIVRGSPNDVLEADLDYLLSQVEDRLGKSLEANHQAHLQILQPMLECCLLIQSLATSN